MIKNKLYKASGAGAAGAGSVSAGAAADSTGVMSGSDTGAAAGAAANAASGSDTSAAAGFMSLFGGGSGGGGFDMGEGPYAFKTLWQEATKAVGYIVNGVANAAINRNNNSSINFQTYWLTADKRADKLSTNTGFYLIIALLIAAVAGVYIMKIVKSK